MAKENTVEVKYRTISIECYKCHQQTVIVDNGCCWSNDPQIGAAISIRVPSFFRDWSHTIQAFYYMNHCKNCKTKLGDYYIFHEIAVALSIGKKFETHKVIAKGLSNR